MFTDNPNLIQLGEKAFAYKNFVPKDLVEKINSFYNAYEREVFNFDDPPIDWYKNKTSPTNPDLVEVWNLVSEFLYPDHVIQPGLSVQIMEPGDGEMFVHADSPGEGNHHMLTSKDRWSTCCSLSWGAVAYFGEFEGGEIFYPRFDIEYAVQPGDLVLHSAVSPWEHGVKEVRSGKRYAYSMFGLETDKNPGSFYNYGTEECKESQKDLGKWNTPLFENPQFKDN